MSRLPTGVIQYKPNSGFQAIHAFTFDAHFLRNDIRRLKSDSCHVLNQLVRIILHDTGTALSVGL